MDFILFLALGAVAGWVASLIMGTDARQGWLMNIVLGIVGAFVGGFLMNLIGQPGASGFNLYSLIVAVIGAVILVWLGGMFLGRRTV
jgi:uncharacterized membrane protein YeaQ/YmgE (transglycosylase-associated protein family)